MTTSDLQNDSVISFHSEQPKAQSEFDFRWLSGSALSVEQLQSLLAQTVTADVDFADFYLQNQIVESWSLDEGIVKAGSYQMDQGIGVRAVHGAKTAFAYSDVLEVSAIQKAVHAVRAISRQGQSASIPIQPPRTGHSLYIAQNPLTGLTAEKKVALLKTLEQEVYQCDKRAIQVMAGLAMQYENILLLRSDGQIITDQRPLIRLSLQVILEENGRRESGSSGGGGRVTLDYFDSQRLRMYAREAVHQAQINLQAIPAPAGTMTVVLGSGWPGILLHEAIGHGLEGDFNRKQTSAFAGRLGEMVAANNITVVDDGTLPNRRGSLNVDDEGHPTQCTTLIENGRLTGYLQDQMNARLMGVPPTGNGRRESYAHLPMPRMTNTYMLGGKYTPDEIISSVESGVYAANFGGGQVDITSGQFVFSAAEAYLIEHGKITTPIKGATLIGNGPEVLKYVSMLGHDLKLDSGVGTCGKEGQSVPVGVGQPTLKIDQLTVGGTV